MNAAMTEEIVRRTLAVIDEPYTFQFFGEHVFSPGTEFILGQAGDHVSLGDNYDLLVRLSSELTVRVPMRYFHLEVEQETRHIRTYVQRWMAPVV